MLFALLLLMPALRRALILAYSPGFELFIRTLYHTHPPTTKPWQVGAVKAVEAVMPPLPCHFFSGPAALKIHYGTPQVKGEGTD